ncbi:MAG TPA: hypothetical protein VLM79_00955 [Kofleriaceae bacterium]|nr:hypothetical protein [Kofleriaceae bacterium]
MDGDPGDVGEPQSDPTVDPSTDPASVPTATEPPVPAPTPGPAPAPAPDPAPVPAPQACSMATPGTVLLSLDTGRSALDLRVDLATDARNNIFQVRGNDGSFMLTKYGPDGAMVYRVGFGEAVATDAAGNAYVAASFSAPIDVGLGEMTPEGNVDVFLAKLSPDGHVLFARPLHLCGDGVRAVAVAADGRIAVSGDAMGTVVLDAHGELLFDRAFAGDLAFDSEGSLIVAGSFMGTIYFGSGVGFTTAGDLDGFVVKLDSRGNHVWSYQFGDASLPVMQRPSSVVISMPTRQAVDAVAVGPNDEVVIAGEFENDLKLFGTDHVAGRIPEASVQLRSGVFTVRFAASGTAMAQNVQTGFDGYADVAVDRAGHVATTGMELAEAAPPFRYARLDVTDASAAGRLFRTNEIGAGHAVAFDACGNLVWSAAVRTAGPAMEERLVKLVP